MDRKAELERWAEDRLAVLGLGWFGPIRRPEAAVAGIDGSAPGLAAAKWAARVAPTVHLVSALGRPKAGGPKDVEASSAWDEVALFTRDEADAALAEAAKALPDVQVDTHLVAGQAAAEVLAHAAETDAGLIAVGHGGKGAIGRALLGSVSEGLVHHAPCSVLVARDAPSGGPIVVGIGDDEGSSEAAAWGIGLAQWLDADVVFAHASPQDLSPPSFIQDMRGARAVTVDWPPRKGIAGLADALSADLVVVGHGSRPGWLGSTAIGALRHAPCSVLVARPG